MIPPGVLAISVLFAGLRMATPLCLAGLGGLFSERSGKANIALEGMILVGGFSCAVCAAWTGSPWLGALAGAGGGLLLASGHALCVVGLGVNALLSGVVMNLLAAGLTDYCTFSFMNDRVAERSAMAAGLPSLPGWRPPVLAQILPSCPALSPLVYLALVLVPWSHVFFSKTILGLRWRAVGEAPDACFGAGIRTQAYQVAGILMSGVLCGFAGSYLVLHAGQFVRGMSAGKGFMALACLIVGNWQPLRLALFCFLLAGMEALQTSLDLNLPTQLMQAAPYLVTLMVLAGWASKSNPPAGLSS